MGEVAERTAYDSFGQILSRTGTLEHPYGFTGREFDAESGLYFYRARNYGSATGKFLQSDPLGFTAGDTNLYAYVWSDPLNFRDPSGLSGAVPYSSSADMIATGSNIAVQGIAQGAYGLVGRVILALSALAPLRGDTSDRSRDTSKISVAPGSALGGSVRNTPSMPPPGDCDKKQLDKWQKEKDRADAAARSCHPKDSLRTIMWNIASLERQKTVRTKINNICFRGGDAGHKQAIQQVENRISNCRQIAAAR